MVFHALVFQGMWWHLTRTGHLFADEVDVEAARATRTRFALGTMVYPVTVGLAFVSAPLTLAVHGLLAVYYAFNQVPVPTKAGAEAEPTGRLRRPRASRSAEPQFRPGAERRARRGGARARRGTTAHDDGYGTRRRTRPGRTRGRTSAARPVRAGVHGSPRAARSTTSTADWPRYGP